MADGGKMAKGGEVKKYAIVDENTDRIYIKGANKEFIDLKFKELKEVYPSNKLSIIELADGGQAASEHVSEGGTTNKEPLFKVVGKKEGQLVDISEIPMIKSDCEIFIKKEGINNHYNDVAIIPYHGTKEPFAYYTQQERYFYGNQSPYQTQRAEGGTTDKKSEKYQVLSPDGFTIEFDKMYYPSKEKAVEAFQKWKKRYEGQGYYSSPTNGRIPIDQLEDYVSITEYKKYAEGGSISDQNTEMLISLNNQIQHHANEIGNILTKDTEVMAWVLAKAERAASDLSDIAHFLDGQKQSNSPENAN